MIYIIIGLFLGWLIKNRLEYRKQVKNSANSFVIKSTKNGYNHYGYFPYFKEWKLLESVENNEEEIKKDIEKLNKDGKK